MLQHSNNNLAYCIPSNLSCFLWLDFQLVFNMALHEAAYEYRAKYPSRLESNPIIQISKKNPRSICRVPVCIFCECPVCGAQPWSSKRVGVPDNVHCGCHGKIND